MSLNTTQDLASFLLLKQDVPDVTQTGNSSDGADRAKEEVGTGDNSKDVFYLRYGLVLSDSYTLYHGTDPEDESNELTESTDYTLDKDSGRIKLTSTGVSNVGTDNIYATYSHLNIGDNIRITDSELQNALDHAFGKVKKDTSTVFVDGTQATPGYEVVTEEKDTGRGEKVTSYFLRNYPLPDVSTKLDGDVSKGATSISVDSTDGFPSSGTISIGTDKISYSSKSGTSFDGVSGVDSDHSDNDTVVPFVVETSDEGEGGEPTWNVLEYGVDYDLDNASGRLYLYNPYYTESGLWNDQPAYHVPNRVRTTYIHGRDSIPDDIKLAELMIAALEIENRRLRGYIVQGKEYSTTTENIDKSWINDTLQGYKSIKAERL